MEIKRSVINTFNRVGIDYKTLLETPGNVVVRNRFNGEEEVTNALIGRCVEWVYDTSNDYDLGVKEVKVLNGMPKVFESIFTVQGIERARLTAYFPAIGGGEKKVAIVECYKFDFSINKSVNAYDLTVYP